jgi:hypothetical protein
VSRQPVLSATVGPWVPGSVECPGPCVPHECDFVGSDVTADMTGVIADARHAGAGKVDLPQPCSPAFSGKPAKRLWFE